MPYLIDGHNLIGQTPALSLDDPHDEVKLVALVRRLCMRERRKATIIFDRGLVGGMSNLSNADVAVIFASGQLAADDLILKRITAEKNPKGLIVISSDQAIAKAARHRGIAVRSSNDFGRALLRTARSAAPEKERGLAPDDIAEWEAIFQRGKSPE